MATKDFLQTGAQTYGALNPVFYCSSSFLKPSDYGDKVLNPWYAEGTAEPKYITVSVLIQRRMGVEKSHGKDYVAVSEAYPYACTIF